MKKQMLVALMLLLSLTQCAPTETPLYHATWDQVSYVNPMVKPQWGAIKSLEQPGIY